jgi:hypothetical protein
MFKLTHTRGLRLKNYSTHAWGLRLKNYSTHARGLRLKNLSTHARGIRLKNYSTHARGLRPLIYARGLRPLIYARGLRLSASALRQNSHHRISRHEQAMIHHRILQNMYKAHSHLTSAHGLSH